MTAVRTESAGCPLGCSGGDDHVLTGYDRLNHGPGLFRVVRCRECGLLRTDPRPTMEAMAAYYPDDYAPYASSAAVVDAAPQASAPRRFIRRLLDSKAHLLPAMEPGRLFEFGCASGGFLAEQRARGWQVEGVDISPSATARARSLGLNVHTGTLETMPAPAHAHDLVVGWMALEHLHDPLGALRLLRRRTRAGGYLVLSLPDASAIDFRLFGARWYALHLPAHLFHFTPDSIGRLLGAAGWELERIHHQRSAGNLVGSLGHLLGDWGWPGLGQRLVRATGSSARLHRFLLPLAWLLGQTRQSGRMTVWAKNLEAAPDA